MENLDTEDVGINANDAEYADLHHGHGMKQRGNGGGRHHGVRQPRVERHKPRLGETESEQQEKHHLGGGREEGNLARVGEKIHRNRSPVEPDVAPAQGRQEQTEGSEEKVTEIGATTLAGFLVLHVGDQRIGRDRQHLIEKVNREQVGREGHAHGGAKRNAKKGIETSLGVLVQPTHIAYGVKRGGDPQHRGNRREGEPETINPQEHGNVGEDLPDVKLHYVARQYEWGQ